MGLLSLFQRKRQPGAPAPAAGRSPADPAAAAEAVREARTRARRRLMGATVLLLLGIIGFPVLFETRPRPIPVDLPIEIPARNPAPTLDATPHPAHPVAATTTDPAAPVSPASAPATPPAPPMITEPAEAKATPAPAPASRPASTARVAAPAVPVATAKPAAAPASATSAVATASAPGDAAADAGHFVVQIGAFAEQPKAHDARMKVEKMGFKTYVQVIDTPGGKRIRVRVGPYATKAEADKAATKIKGDGLPAAVLAL
jgi:DedD protein